MESFCDLNEVRYSNPMSLTIDGQPYAVATNGFVLVLVQAENEFVDVSKALSETSKESIVTWFNLARSGMPTPLASIKEWAGPSGVKEEEPCTQCDASEKVTCTWCHGRKRTICECDCGDQHNATCDQCDGSGKIPCPRCQNPYGQRPPVRIGWFLDRSFDRERFTQALFRFNDEIVKIHLQEGHLAPVHISGSDWHVTLMPMRLDDPELYKDAPHWRERDAWCRVVAHGVAGRLKPRRVFFV